MENTLSLSIILPIKSALAKDFDEYFDKCIKAIHSNDVKPLELVIVQTKEEKLVSFLDSYDFGDLNVKRITIDKEPNFCEQINIGIQNSSGEWVSFYEFDDEYAKIWFRNVKNYIKHYPEVQVFLPVVVDIDEKGVFAGFTNEATFAANFSQEIGYLTNETLLSYQNFQTSGAVFKKEVLKDFGGFKSSIKLTFVYELLLRLTYNSVNIMTVPRIGYKHMNLREGSIFWNYKYGDSKMTEDEVKFWIQSARKEYFFVDERTINYESQ